MLQKGKGGSGAVISRAKLDLSHPNQPKLTDIKQIWQQVPKVSGQGHYGHRMLLVQIVSCGSVQVSDKSLILPKT